MLPVIFVMPLVQLLILSNAATFDITNIRFEVVDRDQSEASRRLIQKFTGSRYFILEGTTFSPETARAAVQQNRAALLVEIPSLFERTLTVDHRADILLTINAEDGSAAGLIQSYAATIIQAFSKEWLGIQNQGGIDIRSSYWYNPELNYKFYMIPGILVALVTMIGLFLSGMNIVREKELGTIEQLNVTPIRKHEFIIGKLLPFWIIGLFELALGLIVAKLVFGMPIVGSLAIVFSVAPIYLVLVLAIGLLISTLTETQQQAMFIAWFFMVVFMLLGGLFTPLDSMPGWAQSTLWINPVALFIRIMRLVLLKGAGWSAISQYVSALSLLAMLFLILAVVRYRKTSD